MEVKEVFEPIISFVKNFQKKEKDISKQAAKDRLKLVLMQDRASVSPDFFEMMKKEKPDCANCRHSERPPKVYPCNNCVTGVIDRPSKWEPKWVDNGKTD